MVAKCIKCDADICRGRDIVYIIENYGYSESADGGYNLSINVKCSGCGHVNRVSSKIEICMEVSDKESY